MSIKSAGILRKLIFIEKKLVITPLLEPKKQLHEGSASVDLRLGTRFEVPRKGDLTHIDPQSGDFEKKIANLQDSYYVNIGKYFVLHPGHFVLATTLETLCLPPNLAGSVVTRSSWGRYGLIIATAVGIHPKFVGVLTLELRNLAEVPLKLYPGRRILQVFFHEVELTDVERTNPDAFDKSSYLASTKPSTGKFSSEYSEIDAIQKFPKYKDFPFRH
jgi:dCTP deaminase